MESLDGILPGAFQYLLEYLSPEDNIWHTLVDASENNVDLSVDYRTFDTVLAGSVRLTVLGSPCGIEPAIINLTVFGTRA